MYNPEYNGIENKGWICPKCGRSLAPWQNGCPYCNDSRVIYANKTAVTANDEGFINDIVTRTSNMKDDTINWRDWLDNMREENSSYTNLRWRTLRDE